jgi:hypothetical protein
MPASCPFCGATLNFGLKFCVVCGRHTTHSEISKLSGLRGGIRQGDATRRLDEAMSASDFAKTRTKPGRLSRHIRSIGEQIFYVLIGLTLFFCAVRFTLSTYFPGKVHQVLAPILGKNSSVIEQSLTGVAPPETEDQTEAKDKDAKPEEPEAVQPTTKKVAAQKKTKPKAKRWRRHWRRTRHRRTS